MPRSDAPGRLSPANRLLALLPPREYARLRPHLEPVPLLFKSVLQEAGDTADHVHFPVSGVISLISSASENGGIEVGVVGREGMAGLSVFLDAPGSLFRLVVQVPGEALRLPVKEFRRRASRHSALHGLLLRYTHAFLTQLSQSIACNSLHPVPQRLCRWLLAVHDRAGTDDFPLTHEFLAAMLGVRRATITEAARTLRQAGVIRYGAGQLTVLDRRGLDARACGCHRTVQNELDRVLSGKGARSS
jgi:CRP-like cAMP-binding protein